MKEDLNHRGTEKRSGRNNSASNASALLLEVLSSPLCFLSSLRLCASVVNRLHKINDSWTPLLLNSN